ncbi:MAG: MFS transporter [Alphaproteobacteria bacterium]|nr:MFS transporter [Alphaproteobacteria bacterium]
MPAETFLTRTPARLDRLPWSRFHTLVVFALGVTWIFDGLEVTLVGALSPAIASRDALSLSDTEVGLLGSAYTAGAVLGALVFGNLTDRWGRKRLFSITVLVYLAGTLLSGLSWDVWSLMAFRFITGAGIGGEYAAVNSTIQELIPARRRGFVDLAINGSFWVGAGLGAAGAIVVLDPHLVRQDLGWRLAFIIGGVLASVIFLIRRFLPESPRWLMTHGRPEEAEAIVEQIEAGVARQHGVALPVETLPAIRLKMRGHTRMLEIARTLVRTYPRRTVLGVTLMTTQAFCYNAIFFTYALVLTKFYGVANADVGWFMLPFALGNFLGPLLLGHFFDSIGRKTMIAITYALAGVLLAGGGWLFERGVLDATGQTIAWTIIFFFASAGASAAYLTVGESFPLETRAMTIGLFYAFGTAIGGVAGPALFGALIESGSRPQIFGGYGLAGGLMGLAAIVTLWLGVKAERRPLEEVAPPLSAADDP